MLYNAYSSLLTLLNLEISRIKENKNNMNSKKLPKFPTNTKSHARGVISPCGSERAPRSRWMLIWHRCSIIASNTPYEVSPLTSRVTIEKRVHRVEANYQVV